MTDRTTETTHLPPCPLEGCEAVEHHWHSLTATQYDIHKSEACRATGGGASRCYGPHRPGLSEPIDLPEITDEMVESARSRSMYDTFGSLRSFAVGIRVALLASIPQWQPIEHDQIKAGMRIRATVQQGDCKSIFVGAAHYLAGSERWYTDERRLLTGWSSPTIYEVDPSTILADPDVELIEKIGKAIHDADESDDEWGEDPSAETYRKLARVALDAVRESEVTA